MLAEQGMPIAEALEHGIECEGFGESEAMEPALRLARTAAQSTVPVLLVGEAGAGKRTLALAIHGQSARCLEPWQEIPPQALGDFLQQGNGKGSIFVPHIEQLNLIDQARLFQMLIAQSRDDADANARPRWLFSTQHVDLQSEVEAGRFHRGLYWHLQSMPIWLAPLRERAEELPRLVPSIVSGAARRYGKGELEIDDSAMELLMQHAWPGNLHELAAVLTHGVLLAESGCLQSEHLPSLCQDATSHRGGENRTNAENGRGLDFDTLAIALVEQGLGQLDVSAENAHQHVVDRVEKELIRQVLLACNHVQTKAASRLGINRNTLHKKVKEYGLDGLEEESSP